MKKEQKLTGLEALAEMIRKYRNNKAVIESGLRKLKHPSRNNQTKGTNDG